MVSVVKKQTTKFKVGDIVKISDYALNYHGIARQAYLQLYERHFIYEVTEVTTVSVEIREIDPYKESGHLFKNVVSPEFLTLVENTNMYANLVKTNLKTLYDGIRCLDNKIQTNIYECIKLMDNSSEESVKSVLDNLKVCCKLVEDLEEEDKDFITSEIADIIRITKKIKFQEPQKKDDMTYVKYYSPNITTTVAGNVNITWGMDAP